MFVRVKVESNLPVGSIVSYNSASDCWGLASDNSEMFGIIEETPQQEGEVWWAAVRFGGVSWALADRDIPNQGGFMRVLNGKVYASATDYSSGVIAPNDPDAPNRVINDSVLVYLR